MSFLNFRSARRRAKKIVGSRNRAPRPSSPDSFFSGDLTERPARAYAIPRADVDVTHRALLASDFRLATTSSDFQNGLMLAGSSVSELRKNDAFAGQIVSKDVTRTLRPLHRPPKATPAPIKIPTTSHASKVQIQRSAGKSAESFNPVNSGASLVPGDTSSAISGTTRALMANMWCVQTDLSCDYSLSRSITRLDSATLPTHDYTIPRDGDSDAPPVPPKCKCQDINDLSKGQSNVPSSPHDIPSQEDMELPTPSPSNLVTPDLTKDSCTSVDGGSSSQPQTSDSASTTWSGPTSNSSPPSGEEIIMLLNVLSAPPPNSKLVSEAMETTSLPSQIDVPASKLDVNASSNLRVLLTEQCQPASSDTLCASRKRSRSRPSFSPLDILVLHPAALISNNDRRISSTCLLSASARSTRSEDRLSSALPSSLARVHSHHISRLPSFPESATISSAFTGSGFQSWSSSPTPPSPDLLDDLVISGGNDIRQCERHAFSVRTGLSGGITADSESRLASRVRIPLSALSGSSQTFPETPSVYSPVISPNINAARPSFPCSSELYNRSRSLHRGRSRQGSPKFMIGRAKVLRTHKNLSKRKPARQTSTKSAVDKAPGSLSSVLGCGENVTVTTKSNEPALTKEPDSPRWAVVGDIFGSTISTSVFCDETKHQRIKAMPLPLTSTSSLPPPPPPPPLISAELEWPFPPPSSSPQVFKFPPSPQLESLSSSPSHYSEPQPFPPTLSKEYSAPPPYRLHAPWHSVVDPASPPDAASTLPAPNIFSPSYTRRVPTRPPLPIGPRNRYCSAYRSSDFNTQSRLRSISSLESRSRVTLMGTRDLTKSSPSGPKFQTSPAEFKVFTLEAARWTFTPDDLQTIVSSAIKNAAEPSFIRLLTTQAAFTDVPVELERLTALQNELKVCYKLQVRKRDALHRAAIACAENMGSSSSALRARLEELAEVTTNLDKTAEELYQARDQAAQLSRMLAVHSGSALALALRRLHASYLRRVAEIKSLQDHVFDLEAERDEAWAQAQQVARDLDDLNEVLQSRNNSPHPSNRSSRIRVSRMSSVRVSKTELRYLRASMSSQVGTGHLNSLSEGPSAPASDVIPPTPPLPRRLSSLNRIITSDIPSHRSDHMSGLSPSSCTRELAKAQADLYGYLGIDDLDMRSSPLLRSSSPLAA